MGFFFTNVLKDRLNAGASLNNVVINISLLSRAPLIEEDDSRSSLRTVSNIGDLLALNGWEEVSVSGYARQPTTTPVITSGNNRYLNLNTSLVPFPSAMGATHVEAVVFSVDGTTIGAGAGEKVLFGTTKPFFSNPIMRGGDGISARIDTTIGQRYLFGWALSGSTVTTVVEGTTVIQQGAAPFEVSHVHHAWLTPQRINYVANPSFEGGNTHWQSTSGAMTRTAGDASSPSPWYGDVTGPAQTAPVPTVDPAKRLYVKSNSFYPQNQDFTFQLSAKGNGIARVGLAYYPRDYSEYAVDFGLMDSLIFEEWTLTNTWTSLRGVRSMSDGYEAALLLEIRSPNDGSTPTFQVDKALCEEGFLLDWEYFDGDSTYGGFEDYSWYGNVPLATKRGKSYSFWYNNRRSVAGRLFGRKLDDTNVYTSADEQLDSLVSQWTPAGAVVFPHWDVLGVDDTQVQPVDRSATTLTRGIWPEAVQPFRIYDVTALSSTSGTLRVVGEGGFPVTGGFILSGSTSYPLTFLTRAAYAPEDLYDFAKPQTLSFTYPSVPAFEAHTFYLTRGTTTSPLSWVSLAQQNSSGGANFAVGGGTANDASVVMTVPAEAATATGQGQQGSFGTTASAGDAAATGVANDISVSVRPSSVEASAASGAGIDAVASITYGVVSPTTAAGTGSAFDAAAAAMALEQAVSTGVAYAPEIVRMEVQTAAATGDGQGAIATAPLTGLSAYFGTDIYGRFAYCEWTAPNVAYVYYVNTKRVISGVTTDLGNTKVDTPGATKYSKFYTEALSVTFQLTPLYGTYANSVFTLIHTGVTQSASTP